MSELKLKGKQEWVDLLLRCQLGTASCRFVAQQILEDRSQLERELGERDKKIKELEGQVEKMKRCENCKYADRDGVVCHHPEACNYGKWEYWQMRGDK